MKVLDIRYPVVCENGAVLYELKTNRAWYAPGVTTDKIHGLRALRCFIEDEVLPAHPEAAIQFGKEAQLSVYSSDPGVFPDMQRRIDAYRQQSGGPELIINASHYYLNISLAGADKGSAIRHIMAQLGLKRDEVAGIGDTVGDLPLRESVGFFACPANSVGEIRKVADYVSPLASIHGMLDILKQPMMRKCS